MGTQHQKNKLQFEKLNLPIGQNSSKTDTHSDELQLTNVFNVTFHSLKLNTIDTKFTPKHSKTTQILLFCSRATASFFNQIKHQKLHELRFSHI